MNGVKEILESFSEKNIRILLDKDETNLRVIGEVASLTQQDKTSISEFKSELVELLKIRKKSKQKKQSEIAVVPSRDGYMVSNSQRRLWVLSQFDGGSSAYNIPGVMALSGSHDVDLLKRSLEAVVSRHDILRTVFKEADNGDVLQHVLAPESISAYFEYRDYQDLSEGYERAMDFIRTDSYVAFDLETGPLLRVVLFGLENERYLFYYNVHHIISDGWSMKVLTRDVMSYYTHYRDGVSLDLPPLRIQYKDYTYWQAIELASSSYKDHHDYWHEELSGVLPVLNLPSRGVRPAIKSYNGSSVHGYLSKDLVVGIHDFVDANGGSLFMYLLSSWSVLLYRYTGVGDIVLGTPVSGRGHWDLEDQIGFYVNTLALRNRVDGSERFSDFYGQVRDKTLSSYEHQLYPFDRLVEELDLVRDTSRNAVFDIMLSLDNNAERFDVEPLSTLEELELSFSPSVVSKFDISLDFREHGPYLSLTINYNSDIYDRWLIEGLFLHYRIVVDKLLTSPDIYIDKIDYVSEPERSMLLKDFNNTEVSYPEQATLVELFEEQVAKAPDHISVVYGDISLTYRELDILSNQFAHYLKETYDVGLEDLVGINLDRSQWLLVSILGVLKSGGVYVPIDPDYPQERIDYLISDSSCKVSIDGDELDRFLGKLSTLSTDKPKVNIVANNLAYVIYTSGSTGKPKGVMVEHSSVVNLIYSQGNTFNFNETEQVVLFSSISFDASVEQLYLALLYGGTLYVASKEELLDPFMFEELLVRQGITHLHAVPSYLATLTPNKEMSLRRIISGGDTFDPRICSLWEPYDKVTIYNEYGPTETTVTSIEQSYSLKNSGSIIGKPIGNTYAYILGKEQEVLPLGVVGDLYIGGSGVARGYLNREDLTASRFLEDPYQPGGRMYVTGDLARWLPDGTIEFMGRKDSQVKIRGYRIELGEIEHVITLYTGVEACKVLAVSDTGDKQLQAYVVLEDKGVSLTSLDDYLRDRLPSYMIPLNYTGIDAIPLTSNGKVDTSALESLGGSNDRKQAYVAPTTDIEFRLVKIWEEVLQKENIGIKDDFFSLGGHSLKAIRLLSAYQKKLGLKLSFKDIFTHTTINAHSRLISDATAQSYTEIAVVPSHDGYMVSNSQRRLWVLSQFDGGSSAYNIPGVMELSGSHDVDLLKRSLEAVVSRHDILRTVFKETDNGDILQHVLSPESMSGYFEYRDYQDFSDGYERAMDFLASDSYAAFDLETGPLLRVVLFGLEKDRYLFYYNVHHIISDGWSMKVLTRDVMSYYAHYRDGALLDLPPLRVQYKDYTHWQVLELAGSSYDVHRDYWHDELSGVLPVLDLPSRGVRPAIKSYNGSSVHGYLSKDLVVGIHDFVDTNGGSLFMYLLSSWSVLLYRYTGVGDIVLGTPVSGRGHWDLEDQIGFYVNTLALRNTVDGSEGFSSFYGKVRDKTLSSYEHQLYPFDRLVEELDLVRDTSRNAVFDIMLSLDNNTDRGDVVPLSTLEETELSFSPSVVSKFDISMDFCEHGPYLSLTINYNSDIYDRWLIEGLFLHYRIVVDRLLSRPDICIDKIDYVSEPERSMLLKDFNNTNVSHPSKATLVDLFEEQVAKTPDHISVVYEDTSMTYEELDRLSNQFAHYLEETYGVGLEDLVGVNIDRSQWLLVCILGVLKSGGAYVPIDSEYPQERIEYMISDSSCKVCIDADELDRFFGKLSELSTDQPKVNIAANNLAYVIYTSGSTGKPKGVMVEHSSVVSLIIPNHYFPIVSTDVLLSTGSVSFDAVTFEYWAILMSGAKLILCDNSDLLQVENLKKVIREKSVTKMWFTSGWFHQLVNEDVKIFKSLKGIIVGGDRLSSDYVNELKRSYPNLEIVQGYGPTETTTFALTHTINTAYNGNIPIGKPIENTYVYILGSDLDVLPVGVVGDLYIGGSGVARGYLNREDLTASRFLDDPYQSGGRMYVSGDLARWLPDGTIEFMGRKDSQVKIRGYRIELGEIEHAISLYAGVASCKVLAVSDTGDKQLQAYVVLEDKGVSFTSLDDYLRDHLPSYMIPLNYTGIDAIPLTSNGKVDTSALKALGGSNDRKQEYVAPTTNIELRLVKIWEEVLQKENIGIKDDFFSLGGHSLKAIRLLSAYQKELGLKLSFKDIFTHTTISAHGGLISDATAQSYTEIAVVPSRDGYMVSNSQRRLWVLSQFDGGSSAYNIPGVIELSGSHDVDLLKRSLEAVVSRHDILRTVFKEADNGDVLQYVLATESISDYFEYRDYQDFSDGYGRAMDFMASDSYVAFDLETGPLLRVVLFGLDKDRYLFYYNVHHIISDGWSMKVLTRDVMSYYTHYRDGALLDLPPLRIQYKDYTHWQALELASSSYKDHHDYWHEELSGVLPVLDLPSRGVRPAIKSYNGSSVHGYLSKDLVVGIHDFVETNGGSLFMYLLSSWSVLLYRYTGISDIILGTAVSGRGHWDLEDQIGFYVNTLALRNRVDGSERFSDFYGQVRDKTLSSYEHQLYPFDRLVEELDLVRDTSRNAVFDIMLSLDNNADRGDVVPLSALEESDLSFSSSVVSKFDISVDFREHGPYLSLTINYNSDIYDRWLIEGLFSHYRIVVDRLLSSPDISIDKIDYVSEPERSMLLKDFNNTNVSYPSKATLVDLFEDQVSKTPDHVSVVYGDTSFTYRELDMLSNQFAHYLVEAYGIGLEDLVGINLDRSQWLLVCIVGVLKSGGAYVPIDPEYPQERIDYMLSDSNCKVCIDADELDRFLGKLSALSTDQPKVSIAANNLAYVIYTSGSTGKPKGVMVEHSSVVNLIYNQSNTFNFNETDQVVLFSSISFDASVEQLYLTLLFGATLHVASKEDLLDPFMFEELLVQQGITHLHAVPSYLATLTPNKDMSLRRVISGGDTFDPRIWSLWEPYDSVSIYNKYGPTETTVTSIEQRYDLNNSGRIIGKPIGNTYIYILGSNLDVLPVGVVGDLYIGGSGVARGYLNREDLTASRFLDDPYQSGGRMYITGDLARWLPDGTIEFMGRKDSQVKIRGYRIELGEIEHVISLYAGVEVCKVLAVSDTGDKQLQAYVVLEDSGVSLTGLEDYLRDRLPSYMIPLSYTRIEAIPLTSNGKVDTSALEALGGSSDRKQAYVAPTTDIELALVKIWEAVLQKENIGIKDDFFSLGGHSLKAIRLLSAYQKELGLKLSFKDVFTHTTISAHSGLLSDATAQSYTEIAVVPSGDGYMVSRNLKASSSNIIMLKTHEQATKNLFVVHDGSGGTGGYLELINLFESYNCWGFNSSSLKEFGPSNTNFEDVARTYIEEIKEVSPKGPYTLLGWSIGGTIVYEMARQLEALGDVVEKLIIIDTKFIWSFLDTNTLKDNFNLRDERDLIQSFLKTPSKKLTSIKTISKLWEYTVETLLEKEDIPVILQKIPEDILQVVPDREALNINEIITYINTQRTLRRANAIYEIKGKIKSEAIFIKASASNLHADTFKYFENEPVFYEIEGTHFSILKSPRVSQLFESINKHL